MSDSSAATSSPFPADAELITSLAHTNASSTPPVTPLSSSLGLLWIDGGFKEQEGTGVAVIAHTKTEKLPKKTRRRDRNRPHHEIARLKTQINEMNRKRQKLLATANESARRFLRARAENEELKKTLRRHVDHTASLNGVLLSQASKPIEVPRSLLVTGRNLMYNAKEDAAVYQMLARNVDEHYGCTNRVLQAAGLLGVTAEIRDSQIRRPPYLSSEKEGYVLQSRMSGLLPFEEELINDTVWRVLTSESMLVGDQSVAKTLGLSLGVATQIVIVKQEVVLHSDGEPSATSCTIRSVLKRFVEKDRVVNVWDAIGDWPCTGAACQVSTRERGWSIVQSVNGEEAAGISVAQNFVLVTPTATAIGADDSTVIECVIRLYQRVIESRDQVMENSFMDESIQRKRITNSKSQST
ncbi:hypothetical protein BBJ28_00019110 [Nothophytophthora sp. Chile5]|nr:hypothetical protein BBJ28_00019110 [Nothophytophthora sp. Chile5]